MKHSHAVLLGVAGGALVVLAVIAGWMWVFASLVGYLSPEDHSATSAQTYLIADGARVDQGTTIGLRVQLGSDWTTTDGSRRAGSMTVENTKLGCDAVVIVASPVKAFPHYMEDEAGSLAILEKFAGGEVAGATSYLYPTAGGGAIETLSQVRTDESRSRIAVAREFGAIDSGLFIDFGCDSVDDIRTVFEREFVADVPAIVIEQ